MLPLWSNGVAIGGKIPCSFIFGTLTITPREESHVFHRNALPAGREGPVDCRTLGAGLGRHGGAEPVAPAGLLRGRRRPSRPAGALRHVRSRPARRGGPRLDRLLTRKLAPHGRRRALLPGARVAGRSRSS